MSFDQDPNEQANISGADLAIMIDELKAAKQTILEQQARIEELCRFLIDIRDTILEPASYLDNDLGKHAEGLGGCTVDVLRNDNLAALAAPRIPEGWQPIETAPRDGTTLLLSTPKGRIASGDWSLAYGVWSWPYVMVEPTHWMPSPAAPKPEDV
ncbi:MAG: hypothetical protein PHG89_10850 [Gallionella sp.]|nr:hypothetical protein [Gallionella sp.]